MLLPATPSGVRINIKQFGVGGGSGKHGGGIRSKVMRISEHSRGRKGKLKLISDNDKETINGKRKIDQRNFPFNGKMSAVPSGCFNFLRRVVTLIN